MAQVVWSGELIWPEWSFLFQTIRFRGQPREIRRFCKGHYVTNPKKMHYYKGNPSKIPYICSFVDSSPNGSHLMIPICWNDQFELNPLVNKYLLAKYFAHEWFTEDAFPLGWHYILRCLFHCSNIVCRNWWLDLAKHKYIYKYNYKYIHM